MTLRIGSMFSGSGILDHAVEQATGGTVAWHCETDPAASAVLAARWPDVPNLGDVRRINWSRVRWGIGSIDLLVGGFPCTDISNAGTRTGLHPGTQSGLWSEMVRAIETLRPPQVLIENVRALLTTPANKAPIISTCHAGLDLHEPGGVVGPDAQVVDSALGAILGDLADLGYDAEWEALSASGAGAPHRRQRVFIVAHTSFL
jgi:DNA-cytosine methyltransferase